MSEFQDIDKTLAFIRDHAPVLAKAKAERIYLQEYKKSLLAILFQESDGKTVSDRENYALSHEKYLKLLAGLRSGCGAGRGSQVADDQCRTPVRGLANAKRKQPIH